MKKLFIFLSLSLVHFSNAQTVLIKEDISSSSYEVFFSIDYDAIISNDSLSSSRDVFVSLPSDGKFIIESNIINSVIVISDKDRFKGKLKSEQLSISNRGTFWFQDSKILHLSIYPFYKSNKIFFPTEISLKISFEQEISKSFIKSNSRYGVTLNDLFLKGEKDSYENRYGENFVKYLKLSTASDDIFRLNYGDLAQYDIINSDPRYLKLFSMGSEIAIYIQGEDDGSFDVNRYFTTH